MDGFQFENFLGPLFESHGYSAVVTQGTGDFGTDLTLRRKGKKIAVQAKRYIFYTSCS
ncbi:restriction endonuclease [Peribacillus sp. FSL E2-0159]|uniref:restriction endonuclease n=1 Tax=Peribacillus sp. FSL E2-0159 TaxID=2975289 RepID=UPI00315997E1